MRRLTGTTGMISTTLRRLASGPRSTATRASVVASALAAIALAYLTTANPAAADPGNSIPDGGARPQAIGDLLLPGQSSAGQNTTLPAAPVLGPLAAQISTQNAAVELLGQQVLQAGEDLARAKQATTTVDQHLRETERLAADLRRKADSAAADAFKRATELGPFSDYATQLHQFSMVAPGVIEQPGGEALSRDLLRATKEIADARTALTAATAAAAAAQTQYDTLKANFDRQSAELDALNSRNTAELVKIENARDAYEQSLGGYNLSEINIDGMTANPLALQAVAFALSHRGDKYVYGATGPSTWDCSGLVLRAFQAVRPPYNLPRVANDQYHQSAVLGKAIQPSKYSRGDLLIPGDIVFFSTDPSDWTKIHHVGIYLGSGRMVHAPNSREVVKISPVYWSELYGAVRLYQAVPAPQQTPPPSNHSTNPPTNPTSPSTNPPTSPSTNPPTSPSTNPPPSSHEPSDPPSSHPQPSSNPPVAPDPSGSGGSGASVAQQASTQ